ncbi:MAG TPA: divalent-cation tolerance protein CutA [Candidatus Methanoperedens sp.]
MFSIVYITAGSMEEARKIGKTLVHERLVACANIFPITSVFRWNDTAEEANEFGIITKTRTGKVEEIEKRVKELHSYEVPCVISFRIDRGSADFLEWINDSVD